MPAALLLLAVSLLPAVAWAQTPAPPPAQTPSAAPRPAQAPPAATPKAATPVPPPNAAAPAPPPPENYTYEPDGRRDPFVNLLGTGTETRATGRRGDGPAGMSVGEISVRGVMQSRGSMIAMIEGPDKKTYIVHQGDKLLDGTIKTINQQGLIVSQEVNDPLSIVKQREVRKVLQSLEGLKE